MENKIYALVIVFGIFVIVFSIFCFHGIAEQGETEMKVLKIEWQRLVDEKGQTCQRCGSTEKEVKKAFQSLKQSLAPLEIKVTLEKKALDPSIFAKDVIQSNRILIGGRPLEEWLGAQVGKSPCEFCCAELGDKAECRTVEVGGQIYETIPANLIVQAGLLAASELMGKDVSTVSRSESKENKSSEKKSCCP
ncbi:MAG: DUF2703 domain-containing protein [Candidatus Omnitrophota bacterium]